MSARKKYFNSSFLQKPKVIAMNEEHKKTFGAPISDMGYPDMGNGRYSNELSYSEWVHFNNLQRCHYNMVESSGPVLATMIIAGLFNPIWSSVLGFAYGIGMLIFSFGYSKKGANGRMFGAVIRSLSSIGLTLLCLYYAICLFSVQALEFAFNSLEAMEEED
jgi:hypothetical protein